MALCLTSLLLLVNPVPVLLVFCFRGEQSKVRATWVGNVILDRVPEVEVSVQSRICTKAGIVHSGFEE